MFKKIIGLLSKKERRKAAVIFFEMIIMAIIEVIGIASIFPFIAILSNTSIIHTNKKFFSIYQALHFSSIHQFLLLVGISVLLILVIGNLFSAFTMWQVFRFSNLQDHSLSSKLLRKYLSLPYDFFLRKNPSELVKNIFSEVSTVTNDVYVTGMLTCSKLFSVLLISTFLLVFNPLLAIIMIVSFLGIYVGITLLLKKTVNRQAGERHEANERRFKLAFEGINAIQDIKLMGVEDFVVDQYKNPSRLFALRRASGRIIAELPKYFLEVIAFGGILVYLLYLISLKKDFASVVPVLSVYVYAGFRLMPALHFVYNGYTAIRFSVPALDRLYQDLVIDNAQPSGQNCSVDLSIVPQESILLSQVSYRYPSTEVFAINDINMIIPANKSIGLVGETGAGKSTLVGLLLGLLVPTSGGLFVDDIQITEKNLSAYQKNISFVPQNIYLIDDTIEKNIAFGLADEEIDHELVERVASLACLDEFITAHEDGFNAVVGDRGVRISGGQRQRIGIARALYQNAKMVIFDEATSALDNITETKLLQNIFNLTATKTVIMIAHRLSTIERCDLIYVISSNGKIVGQGTYQELLNECSIFQGMVNSGGY